MREVVFRVRHRGEPESDVSAAFPNVTMRSMSSMTGRGDRRRRIIELAGDPAEIESFLAEFRTTDPIITAEPLSPLGESRVYVAIEFDATRWDSISERLSDIGVHYRMGTSITDGWERWTLYLEEPDRLSDIVSLLEADGNDVRLVRNVELSELSSQSQLDGSQLLAELTPRQREALRTAIGEGYYGVDRRTNVEAVAERMGVSQSTAWEHLVRAEAKVMDWIADYLD